MATFTQFYCGYQTHKSLTKGLKTNPNKAFVKRYRKFSDKYRMMIFYNNKGIPICERCLEFCKSIGQMNFK